MYYATGGRHSGEGRNPVEKSAIQRYHLDPGLRRDDVSEGRAVKQYVTIFLKTSP